MAKTLEQEFAEYKEHHIYEIVVSGLIVLEGDGIYDHELLKDYKDCNISDKKEKAYYVADDLCDKYVDNDDNRYLEVYEMLWNIMKNYLSDGLAVRIGVNYD